jgi:hypothetical protein
METPVDAERSTGYSSMTGTPHHEYFLLNDQPVARLDDDLLGMTNIAAGIASVIVASMRSSPFVLAVDAGWGMGKSTLLRQIENRLSDKPRIVKLRFNAWTAEGENALEGLIKAVLGELDRNVLRRWARRLARQQRLMGVAWLFFGVATSLLGVGRVVDQLWSRMAVDAKSRNELRDLIHRMLSDWISAEGNRDPDRALVVFIDDLDRCSDEVVVKVCEAVKLYLDAPGLIFVLACDQSVLARGVALSARGGTGEGRAYLEKIVQVAYRMPPPDENLVRRLIRKYAQASGTADLIDYTVQDILIEGTGRNPRRIKRIINSFILEYSLDPAWRESPLSSALLVTAVLLQHLYAPFYDLLVSEEAGEDPIVEFLDYVRVREKLPELPADAQDPYWETVRRTFAARQLLAPESLPMDAGKLRERLKELEGQLPASFVDLAKNNAFVVLLKRVEKSEASAALRAQLVRRPLATTSMELGGLTSPELTHLKNLYAGSALHCARSEPLQAELRHLRAMGLITAKHYISEMPEDFDLSEWVQLTSRGEEFVRNLSSSSAVR